jgi:hypothetical protein
MNSIEAKRIFYDQYEKLLMNEGHRFTLTTFIAPYKGILYRETDKILFIFDVQNKFWKRRSR